MSAASFDAPGADRVLGSAAYRLEDFPGCESFHLPASELDHYEGRLEFWDGVTETAWKVCEPTSIQHEQPSRQLAQIAGQIRDAARVADRVLRLGGPGAPGCGGAQTLADAGRRGVVSAPGPGAVAGAGHRRRRGPAAGGGAGGGPLDGRAPSQARHLQGERVSGDLGAGAVGGVGARAGARNPCAPGDRISGGRREQGVSGVEGGGDSPRAHRGAMVGDGVASPGTDRSGDGCARGHDAAARSAHGIGERKGAGKEPRPGSPGGSRARSPGRPCGRSCGKPCGGPRGRPHGRCGRCPRIPGDRADPGDDEAPGAVQRNSGNGRGGSGAGVYRRS